MYVVLGEEPGDIQDRCAGIVSCDVLRGFEDSLFVVRCSLFKEPRRGRCFGKIRHDERVRTVVYRNSLCIVARLRLFKIQQRVASSGDSSCLMPISGRKHHWRIVGPMTLGAVSDVGSC